jgi:membrane associated rhomboid family serine protease
MEYTYSLSDFASQLNTFVETTQVYILPWLLFFAGLWCFNIINWITGSYLNILGIYPRHLLGLVGIVFCPFLHQNFTHLFFNSIPLFVLGLALLAKGPIIFYEASIFIAVMGGLLVWIFGRPAMHIGASGLISGYFGYILSLAYFHPNFTTLLLACMVIYYFGGIFLGILPSEKETSWESHLFGFISGIVFAYVSKITL